MRPLCGSPHPFLALRLSSAFDTIRDAQVAGCRTRAHHAARMTDVRFVIVHKPGPAWKPGIPVFEQAGLQQHVDHYRAALEAGRLALGGPFLDAGGGGMMIAAPGATEGEMTALAASDPTVQSGLLTFEVRQWLIGMRNDR